MTLVSSFRPDIFEPLCDTASTVGNETKRIRKSVDRTLTFLDKTLEIKNNTNVCEYLTLFLLNTCRCTTCGYIMHVDVSFNNIYSTGAAIL